MRQPMPLVRRFAAKFFHDVLPTALASLIGGVVLTHYGLGRVPQPVAAQATPASPDMMMLLRDEHALVANYLDTQLANEKQKLIAAKEEAARAAADGAEVELAATETVARPVAAIGVAKPVAPRGKTPIVGASLPPLVVAAETLDEPEAQSEAAKPAERDDDSLLARTIGIKDHVIAATQRAVSVIGGIPSWIGSIGDRIGGEGDAPRPPANLMSAS
jgi:hypothetical protein